MRKPLLVGAGVGVSVAGYLGLVTGRLNPDLGVGRRTRPLGPRVVHVAAPREVVYDVATAPYAERRPRAMKEKVEILERSEAMVLAAHRTPIGLGLTAVTVETVSLERPDRIGFRVVRGPVPHVRETFDLEEAPTGTWLTWSGELGADLWALGQGWSALVARTWTATVQDSLETIKTESERRARPRA